MNERLKALMLEAGYAAPELAGRAQKLAELIIKECADIALWQQGKGYDVSEIIKDHFGVE